MNVIAAENCSSIFNKEGEDFKRLFTFFASYYTLFPLKKSSQMTTALQSDRLVSLGPESSMLINYEEPTWPVHII